MRLQRFIIWVTVVMVILSLAACSDDSSDSGEYFAGRTLHLNVVSVERVPEFRYATIDPEEVVRHWRIMASGDGLELVLVRLKVENHTAISVIVNVDQQAAELRDFIQGTYFPVDLGSRLYQDLREQSVVTVRVDKGQCFDPNQLYISKGTTVNWVNEDSVVNFVRLDPKDEHPVSINPGESYSHTFTETGKVDFQCGTEEGSGEGLIYQQAKAVVEETQGQPPVEARSIQFINGSFELQLNMGIDGWMVFEAPEGTEFRELRWRAGDSIFVEF